MATGKSRSSLAAALSTTWRRWIWPAFFLLLALFSGYLVFNRDSGVLQVLQLKQERDQLRQEIVRLQNEREELESQIKRLEKVDPFVIEEEARRKGMVREGDEVYRLKYEELPDSTNPGPGAHDSEGR